LDRRVADDDKPDSFDAWVKSVNDRLALQDEFLMKTLQQVERVRDLNQALMDLITVREFHEWRRVADFRPELATASSAERDHKAAEVTVDHIASRCPDSVKAERSKSWWPTPAATSLAKTTGTGTRAPPAPCVADPVLGLPSEVTQGFSLDMAGAASSALEIGGFLARCQAAMLGSW
jgi:hypothetical protein